MLIKTKISLILSITFLSVLVGGFLVWRQVQKIDHVQKVDLPEVAKNIVLESRLNNLTQVIRYYDELLTQSARNYAFTADTKWEKRYREAVSSLDEAIVEAISLGGTSTKNFLANVDESNKVLVEMEERAMELTSRGQKLAAQSLLDSGSYWDKKKIYQNGLDGWINERNEKIDEVSKISTGRFQELEDLLTSILSVGKRILVIAVSLVLVLLVLLYLVIRRSILEPLSILRSAQDKIAQGVLDEKLDVDSRDEIGLLVDSFNQMAEKLRSSRLEVENKVLERTKELEQVNQLMIGRELQMIELKKQLAKVKNQNVDS